MRVLLVGRPGTLTRFTSLVRDLAQRGHRVTLVIRNPHPLMVELAQKLHDEHPNVTYEAAPLRGDLDGWRYVGWLVRGLGDLARYSHPRYDAAPVLRERMAAETRELLRKKHFEPLSRVFASAGRASPGVDRRCRPVGAGRPDRGAHGGGDPLESTDRALPARAGA